MPKHTPTPTQPTVNPSQEPAGYKRDEAKAIATDQLAQAADQHSAQGVNVAALQPDEELQYNISMDASGNFDPQPGFSYRWVYVGALGRDTTKSFSPHQTQGWRAVKCGDPEVKNREEAAMNLNALGFYQDGDSVLMRIPTARKQAIDKLYQDRARAQEATTLEEARALAPKVGLRLLTEDEVQGTMQNLNQQSAQYIGQMKAGHEFNQMLKSGSIPGKRLSTQNL